MDIKTAIAHLVAGKNLSTQEMSDVMSTIMQGQASDAQIGGLLVALRMKGETVDELVGAVSAMRTLASVVDVSCEHLIDTCGTGGSGSQIFNVSTACAFVVSAAGAKVAKHGNRGVSSQSGSADVLEAAGIPIDLNAREVGKCIEHLGVGFMFAPNHHRAVRHVVEPRKQLGVRTLFNLIGPLTNPANTPYQLLGLFDQHYAMDVAKTLDRLGSRHVLVVHGEDGLDEITLSGQTQVTEVNQGQFSEYKIKPEDFGLKTQSLAPLRVKNAQESLDLIHSALDNKGAAADIVSLNAGAALYAVDLVNSIERGVERARQVIADGRAKKKFAELIAFTQAMR